MLSTVEAPKLKSPAQEFISVPEEFPGNPGYCRVKVDTEGGLSWLLRLQGFAQDLRNERIVESSAPLLQVICAIGREPGPLQDLHERSR